MIELAQTKIKSLNAILLVLLLSNCGTLSQDQEARLGQEQVEEIASNSAIVSDPEVLAYIGDLSDRLLAASPSPNQPITVRVIDSDTFSAFAIPGGNVYLTSGTIKACRNVSELASILAHEFAHVQAGHITRNYQRFRAARSTAELAGISLAVLTGNPFVAGAGDIAANVGSAAYIGVHSRDGEREADQLAFEIMVQAGYDPTSQLTLLMQLMLNSANLETPPPFLLTHPLPQERVTDTEIRLESMSPERRFIVNDDGRLESIQRRLQ